MLLTTIDFVEDEDEDQPLLVSVHSLTSVEPQPTDAFIRFVNDELVEEVVEDYDMMGFQNISGKQVTSFRAEYVSSYSKTTNAEHFRFSVFSSENRSIFLPLFLSKNKVLFIV